MSTSYEIAKSGPVEFVISEGSNKFDLCVDDFTQDQPVATLDGLTTEQLIAVATKMLRVASYWGTDAVTTAAIRNAGQVALDYSNQLDVVEVPHEPE